MTFLQKYLVTPALGAAGLFVGYRVYRNRFAEGSPAVPPAETAPDEVRKLSEQLKEITSRLSAVEKKTSNGEWLEMVNSRFMALEERMAVQGERIASIDGNYHSIEGRLESILHKLDVLSKEKPPIPIESFKEKVHSIPAEMP